MGVNTTLYFVHSAPHHDAFLSMLIRHLACVARSIARAIATTIHRNEQLEGMF